MVWKSTKKTYFNFGKPYRMCIPGCFFNFDLYGVFSVFQEFSINACGLYDKFDEVNGGPGSHIRRK